MASATYSVQPQGLVVSSQTPQPVVYAPPVAYAGQIDPMLPLGPRGGRPVWIGTDPIHTVEALRIPGVVVAARGGVLANWDAILALRVRYRWALPETPHAVGSYANVAGYLAKGLDRQARIYQPAMTEFLAQRTMAINADPMRVGKTFETLAAAELIGARKVLVIPPAIAKPGWAEQIGDFLGEEALLLSGRAGIEARWYCKACRGTGWVNDNWCAACRARNGSSYGSRLVQGDRFGGLDDRSDLDEATLMQAHVVALRKAVTDAIEKARFVICNYDVLVTQQNKDAAGGKFEVEHLRGWSQILTSFAWDIVIADEAHILRGRPQKRTQGKTRRDRTVAVARAGKRFWALTGTPIYGRVADGWGLLDAVTDGLFGRPQYDFEGAYAQGMLVQDDARGVPRHWEAKGSSNELELQYRLATYMLRRERKDIVPFMPPKQRQVVRLDARRGDRPPPRSMDSRAGLHDALRRTAAFKQGHVVEEVLAELSEGMKCVVCTYHVESAKLMYDAIVSAAKVADVKTRMKAVGAKGWLIHGGVPAERRKPIADEFIAHAGAAFIVCSMGSVPGAISFKGAATVHFADLHHDPAILLQVEDRAYEVGTTGLTIRYYVVTGTVDEHVVGVVVPKMDQLERVVGDTSAGDFTAAFGAKLADSSADEIMERMLRAAESME